MSWRDWLLFELDPVHLGIAIGVGFFVFFWLVLIPTRRLSHGMLSRVPGIRERQGDMPTLRYLAAHLLVCTVLAAAATGGAIALFVAGAELLGERLVEVEE